MAKATKTAEEVVEDYNKNIRNKSIRQIVKESQAQDVTSEAPEESEAPAQDVAPIEEPKAEVHLQSTEEREKELEEIKTAAQAAKEAKEASDALKEELQKIKDSDKSTKEKEEAEERARAKWSAVDPKTGKPTPKDYEEIVAESVRIAREEANKAFQDELKRLRDEIKGEQEADETKRKEEERLYNERLEQVNRQVESELNELYALGKLSKPKNINDENDPSARQVKELFKQAAEFNLERQKKGEPLEPSISKFFFMYYKPKDEQPAGADAPISGGRSANVPEEDKIDYLRDIHNVSFRQILHKGAQKIRGR